MAFGSLLAVVNVMFGYVARTDDSNVYVIKWPAGSITLQNQIAQTATSDGSTLRDSVNAAMEVWNAQLGVVQLVSQTSSSTTYSSGNRINEIVIDDTVDGQAFAAGTLAVTTWYRSGNDTTEADIVFNSDKKWDSYRGNLRGSSEDIRRVAIHELGHALGLDHPNQAGQSVVAIMNSRVSDIDTLQPDDIAGGRLMYGTPGVSPANDNFSAATTITLVSGSMQLAGSNIGATRETGEPNHATALKGHSVWWKWTPTSSGTATFSTLGSNFDTVLAVYGGSHVSTLTAVGSNDDAESPSQNSSPQRKRTSTVDVSVIAGTTYYIAVDGWLDSRPTSDGYTGSITLTATFEPPSPPVFTQQPSDQTVLGGGAVQFATTVGGAPPPAYYWEIRLVGGLWRLVTEGNDYTGTRTATLTVNAIEVMDGHQFRCVASNIAGRTISEPATLHVTRVPPAPGSTPLTSRLVNISARGFCSTNDRVMIGGFVVSGRGSKRVLVRAVGPSLAAQGLNPSEVLADPIIEVHKGAPVIASNDNWGDNANAAEITSTAAQIGAVALPASDTASSALLLTLEPGVYSFIASGKNGGSGIVLLEVYDADVPANEASFLNISTRAYATTGDGVTIGGFVISGEQPKQVLLRAVGPTLTAQGIGQADVLVDPMIELHQNRIGVIATNDNWIDNSEAAMITTTGARVGALPFATADTKSSALLMTLDPGVYSFIASGKSASSGIVLVEVYDAD